MAGMVRGACLTGGWSLSDDVREAFIERMADTLLATSFHWRRHVGEPASRARSVEARAYATACVASTTTTGERPHVEGVRVYVREAAKLVASLLADAGGVGREAAAEPGVFTLVSADREFLTAERAAELLAPLLAPGAAYSKVRRVSEIASRRAEGSALRCSSPRGAALEG
jgi:hypothetical protein